MAVLALLHVAIVLVLPWGYLADNHRRENPCACLMGDMKEPLHLSDETEDAKSFELVKDNEYGKECFAWDETKGTPYYDSYCANGDYCGNESWCGAPWCWVSDQCHTASKSDLFPRLWYSYRTCDAQNCFGSDSPLCPYDPKGECPGGDQCGCIGHDELMSRYPEVLENDPPFSDSKLVGNYMYGSSCAKWDSRNNTPWFEYCHSADHCGEDSWCGAPWCFVRPSCPSGRPSGVYDGVNYSYAACHAPNCWTKESEAEQKDLCPYDPLGKCDNNCGCLYENMGYDGAVTSDSTLMNNELIKSSQYGSSCMAWDASSDKAPWWNSCDPNNKENDFCEGANWCRASWCFVSPKCKWASPSMVFESGPKGHGMYYSYEVCGYPSCPGGDQCPIDPEGTCPHSTGEMKEMTCGDVKDFYKMNQCCGNPEKMVMMP